MAAFRPLSLSLDNRTHSCSQCNLQAVSGYNITKIHTEFSHLPSSLNSRTERRNTLQLKHTFRAQVLKPGNFYQTAANAPASGSNELMLNVKQLLRCLHIITVPEMEYQHCLFKSITMKARLKDRAGRLIGSFLG